MAVTARPILIDTHFILWLRMSPQYLIQSERDVLDAAATIYVSIASLWEIAILLGRERIPRGTDQLLGIPAGCDLLTLTPDHCKAVARLPHHHRDPFDRMLVAQAQTEQVPLLTRDRALTAYAGIAPILLNP